jgi:Ribbon-helix-helix protein, copG family
VNLDTGRQLRSSSAGVDYILELTPHMETIQVVLDAKLLRAADRAAQRTKQNRSAFVREALREHPRRLELHALEERDRAGYTRHPQAGDESLRWEAEATWRRRAAY